MKKASRKTLKEIIYCADCWRADIGPVCRCLSRSKDRPYFCGNCDSHVVGIKANKVEPIIDMILKSKIPVPEEIASYSWGNYENTND